MSDSENHNRVVGEFIELANKLQKQDLDPQLISAGLMAASGIYVTFTTAGNHGVLKDSGIDKAVEMYTNNLKFIQQQKRKELEAKAAGNDPATN
ncbi:MAG: DUF3144 domain-containing protein [Xanthomonadales bacterium]|nr:DUF3144 domain-containing protein [Xanthomonadales bacterium]